MSTKQDGQSVKIIPWVADERTKWSDAFNEKKFREDSSHDLNHYVMYFLWESSTECMVSTGLPTDADVRCWIEWLSLRDDAHTSDTQSSIGMCQDYLDH